MSHSLLFNLELTNDPELVQRELALEEEALQLAIDRATKKVETQGVETTGEGQKLIAGFMPELTAAIDEWVETQRAMPRKRAAAYKYIEPISADALAFIVSRQTIHGICMEKATFQNGCTAIGRSCRDFLEYEVFSNTHAETAKITEYRMKHATNGRKGLRVLRS